MFTGHYAPALAGAGLEPKVKLWHLFLAAQLLDYLWAGLVLAGVEHVRIVPGLMAGSDLDLHYMPYSHSLPMALLWSVLAAGVFWQASGRSNRAGAVWFGAVVFSHWVLDLLVHRPDLELWIGGPKAGFGLWNYAMAEFGLELVIVFAALGYYLAATRPKGRRGRVSPLVLAALLVAGQVFATFGPPPGSPAEIAVTAVSAYTLFVLAALWVDRTRAFGRG